MARTIPRYEQVAPAGLHTLEELEVLGLRPCPGELPAALLRVRRRDTERTTGVYRLDQTEPCRNVRISA